MLFFKKNVEVKEQPKEEKSKDNNISEDNNIKVGPIITIAREFGSGGREIAEKVANKLKFKFCDKEEIIKTAKENGIDTKLFEQVNEKNMDSFWFNVSPLSYDIQEDTDSFEQKVNNDKMFMIQSDTIREIAKKGNVVFVGRCASYILKNDATKIFITAKMEDKIERIKKRYNLSKEESIKLIELANKKREKYYDYYTNTKWNAPENYDLIIDVSGTGIEGAVNKIVKYVEKHN